MRLTFKSMVRRIGFTVVGLMLSEDAILAIAAEQPKPADPRSIAKGRELFLREWVPKDRRSHGGDGLGPVYNDRSCLGCHHQGPTGGGGGSAGVNIELISPAPAGPVSPGAPAFSYAFSFNYGPDGFEYRFGDPTGATIVGGGRRPRSAAPNFGELVRIHPGFREAPSVVLHRYGNDADYRVWRDWVLGPHGNLSVRVSQRNPTPLFGLGLIDAIPDPAIEAAARRRHPGWSKVNGRVSRLSDGRIGRFGWKAQTATLRDFVVSAAAVEMGLEVPGKSQAADPRVPPLKAPGLDMSLSECDDLVVFVRALPRPEVNPPGRAREESARKAGRMLFRSTGCAECHLERLGGVEGLYSDLLLHAMAPDLADTSIYGALLADEKPAAKVIQAAGPGRSTHPASTDEWRTPPLWGLRDSSPYLHDGRAGNLDEAIRMHGGEAETSAARYRQLSSREQSLLQSFLVSLAAPDLPGLH